MMACGVMLFGSLAEDERFRVRRKNLFKTFVPILFLLWMIPLAEILGQGNPSRLTPKEIVDQVDRLLRGESSTGTAQMAVVTQRWKRTITMRIWSEGTEKVLIRVLKPEKEAGTTTLKVGTDIWNYLPKIDRTIRIPTSMMMASWMGSHFTNDDLVKESRLIRDFDIQIAYEGEREGIEVYEFRLTPYPEAPVVWGQISYEVRQKDLMPTWAKYYGEDGQLKRTLTFSNYKVMGGRLIPSKLRMVPEDEPEEATEISYLDLEFDIPIPDQTFSLSALRRRT
jgi:outer membrane lipoprotein-sorting protein